MMDYLRRDAAPLSNRLWTMLDEAVAQSARHVMAARRVATFDGPKGWDTVAVRQGTMRPCHPPEGKASVCIPDVVLLAEIRVDFSLPWAAIEVFERGAPTLDTRVAEDAARELALAEDRLAFYGATADTGTIASGFLTGGGSPRVKVGDWGRPGQLLADLVSAVEALDEAGIAGPYEAVLTPDHYYAYHRATAEGGGYPASRHLRELLAGVHRSPVLREAGAVFSTRGGDFILTVGGDFAVGYRQHDRDAVHLMCVETIAAQTQSPEALCLLARDGGLA
jgi:uncharacterized linocin/CFP29 family protein